MVMADYGLRSDNIAILIQVIDSGIVGKNVMIWLKSELKAGARSWQSKEEIEG